jgi:membrane fusion protein (multidrug efflux system)
VDKTQAEVLVQEAAVETAKADIEKARLNVDYTEVVAPIDGRIDVAAFDVGNLIGPDSGVLATINRMDPIKVTFSLAETWYLEILQTAREHQRRVGEPEDAVFVPLLRLPDRSLYQHPGRFDFIDNKVDETTGTVLIRAEFPNPDLILLPGQFVTVVIERKEAVDRVLIPQAAVLTDQGGHYVLLVNDEDRIEARRIETGQRFGPNLVVESGLRAGERIVLYGIQKVRPGLQVKPEPAAAPSDPMDNATEVSVATEEAARPAAADDSPARDMGEGETPDAGGGSGEPIEGSAKDESGGEQPSEDEAE